MRKLLLIVAISALTTAAFTQAAAPTPAPAPQTMRAVLQTTDGNITCELFPDKAPLTVQNFVGLATGTKDWTNPMSHAKMHNRALYDGTIFHRVIPGFMIQGGDPAGTGAGDPGYAFKDEFSGLRFDQPGRLAMANSGPNTNGSQFFITEVPTPHLNNRHTIFGQCEPMSIVSRIARAPRDPNDKPFHPTKIVHISILKPGEEFKPGTKAATPATAHKAAAVKKPAAKAKQ
jgi:peptidyl-prolyl cis-trans isomerase A (cyclophilin A)